ncbi:MAG: bifunctional 4-hydroxy-2-oxoglutarate aldolase/2-dehydro-3-deoxy-phosphogluconate aldolase [Rhizobiales bacterium]|nr:bifunctional 4-hydroxy-2-oxoglutarate aldolase/2-dehydro-3-deoxy-phosphogluconate aldolase [Hyphomicrobiales bacterium]
MIEHLANRPIVPVIEIANSRDAVPLAESLLAGGIDVIEVTFRTAAAADAISQIKQQVPDMLVGAGTVVSQDQIRRALEIGVDFGVAPGLNPGTIAAFQAANTPFLPGVATPSEIEKGLSLGCKLLKFFPAEASGGIAMLKALSGPYASLGVQFCPTGGVNLQNLQDYLSLPTVASIGGSWIATKQDIETGDWDGIATRASDALERARAQR